MSAAPPPSRTVSPAGDWVLPLQEAVVTTRAALVTGASAFSLTLLAVLAVLDAILLTEQPGNIVPWASLPLIPLAVCCVVAWRVQTLSVLGCFVMAVLLVASLAALTVATVQSPTLAIPGTAGFRLSMCVILAVVAGATVDRWTRGVAGAMVGYTIATGTIMLTALVVGLPVALDVPPMAVMLGVVLAYTLVPIARRRGRRGTARLQDADRRARARRTREEEGRESIALLHDTLLGELAVLAQREPGALDDAERARIAASLESSAVLPLLHAKPSRPEGVAAWLVSLGAAGGVRVHVEGELSALDEVAEPAYPALRAALEQCIVNVVRHAGVAEAWLSISASAGELSVTLVDQGVGFDPDAVPNDRLGLSESVRGRLKRRGGSVRVWSSPGAGTSVHLIVPWRVTVP